jgi:hypothetical protein
VKETTGLVGPEDRKAHGALDRLVDRLAARLWRRRAPRGLLIVFTLGRGDLMLFAELAERFRPLLEPGEEADILLRDGVRRTAFVLPDWLGVRSLPARNFERRALIRLFWSLRLARRRYRRALVFDTAWSPQRDERIARLATGGAVPDCAISFADSAEARAQERRERGTARYFLNEGHRHTLEFWAEFAAALTGVPAAPVVPRLDPARLAAPAQGPRPHVVLHPFPSFASKYFAPAVYEPLLAALAGSRDVLISSGPGDLAKHPEMRALAEHGHVRFVEMSLAEITPWVRGADLVVSVDTALAHLGIGCGTPTLVVHNTDDPGVYVPYPESLRPADAVFLAVAPDPRVQRGGWKPHRPWEAPPETGARLREAALGLLERATGRR